MNYYGHKQDKGTTVQCNSYIVAFSSQLYTTHLDMEAVVYGMPCQRERRREVFSILLYRHGSL